MRLISARVKLFRNIVDSGMVEIDALVTALVGKNEAGKSAFLNALYRLNPAYKQEFDTLEDSPRWRRRADERDGVFDEVPPIEAWFEMDAEDQAALEAKLGFDPGIDSPLVMKRYYSNNAVPSIDIHDEKRLVAGLLHAAGANKNHLGGVRPVTLEELWELSEQAIAEALSNLAPEEEDEAKPTLDESLPIARISKLLKSLRTKDTAEKTVAHFLAGRIPRFFLFDEWSALPGRIELNQLAVDDPEDLKPSLRTALSLVTMSGGTIDEFLRVDYETRKADLEASANEISAQVFEYWTQNDTLNVIFDSEDENVTGPEGQQSVVKWLQVRILDTRHRMTQNFDRRSTGFQWFFSFLAAFHEYELSQDIVVLLDEPGLGLHGRAQKDFMRFINERLAASHQVVYSTHSPFMVEPGHLDRVRLVEDDPDLDVAATVTSDIRVRDPDTLFPLQGALGYDIAQALFVAGENLVVEGVSDFIYLNTISDHLLKMGRVGQDDHWNIVPVGGVSKISTFVALLGVHRNVTVLVDSTRGVNDRLDDLEDSGILAGTRILRIGDLVNRPGNIEDLFTPSEYLNLYNEAFGTTLKAADLPIGTDSIVRRLTRLDGEYNHAEPAITMLRIRDAFFNSLSENTIGRFETIFSTVNQTTSE